ncbi:MAG: ROK family protein [Ramlibacter sp.]
MDACIDIGGTKVAVSLSSGSGLALFARRSEPTAKTGPDDALARQIVRLVDEACAEIGVAPRTVQRAGVSSAGPFVIRDGLIELAAPNICGGIAGPGRGLPNDWLTAPLEAPLRERFAKVRIENDCVAALEAERRWGALRGYEHCAYVTWSTGIGVGLCVDGRLLHGKNGNAGHAGHMFVSDNDDALCGCGNVGDVEALVAGNAIERRFGADAATVMQRAQAGDAAAEAVVADLCRIMGRALYNLTTILDLQRISLGGSVFTNNSEYLLPRLQREVSSRFPALTAGCELVAAGLGERVGDHAALALLANGADAPANPRP